MRDRGRRVPGRQAVSGRDALAPDASRTSYPFHHGREHTISYPVGALGIRTRVVEAGAGDRVLVCLHGAGSRADRFGPVMPALAAAGWHVYAIDFPGHGFADKGPDLDYRPRALGDFVAAVLDALGLSGVTVAGTSLGGHVGARITCDRPDLVAALVLIGTTGISELPQENQVAPEVVSDGSPDAVRRKFTFLVSDPDLVTDAWVREESMINSSPGAREGLHRVALALNSEANTDRQHVRLREERPGLPVLLVWGADDRWTPLTMGEAAHRELPAATLAVMPGCGHAPYFEDPDSFVAILSDFFGVSRSGVSQSDSS
ncbi:alpha/beta hydrolase [Streptomyces sp. NBC_00075]|uniref:alpha/beta fold hydrolase n=1 Tax=Streptomyces sp. NBC_00075 TaxID=2975641 RepID=UPI003250E8EA